MKMTTEQSNRLTSLLDNEADLFVYMDKPQCRECAESQLEELGLANALPPVGSPDADNPNVVPVPVVDYQTEDGAVFCDECGNEIRLLAPVAA